MQNQKLLDKVRRLGPWFHQIDVGEGVLTRCVAPLPGPQPMDHPLQRWNKIKDVLPADMSGIRVLDVGCSDGFFSIEMARRGAQVLSLDAERSAVRRLRWLQRHLGIQGVCARTGDIYRLDEGIGLTERLRVLFHRSLLKLRQVTLRESSSDLGYRPAQFDLVFMFALLYHLTDPLKGLERVAPLGGILCIETIAIDDELNSNLQLHVRMDGATDRPKWFPTTRCLKDMLRWAGYAHVVEIAGTEDKRPIYLAYKEGADLSRWRLHAK
ncbi:MAG TPA: methyltransferase domain-containing protein [Gammaproteobacteria bacterium]|nr:methyltransferase domain-containing protein [Gammaproteobacteria bacterium]